MVALVPGVSVPGVKLRMPTADGGGDVIRTSPFAFTKTKSPATATNSDVLESVKSAAAPTEVRRK
eukprot:scaffold259789_cov30-Tisochrysis_lutea.AAC.5